MAIQLLNILPSTAIANDIPYTRLYGKDPNYTLLRIFGCLCYPHLYPSHKLEPRATPSIFLGFASSHRGYRCLDLHTNKIIISRHVTFDETVFPYGSTIPKSTSPYTFLEDTFDLHPTLPNPAFTTPTIGQTDPLPHQQHPTEPASQQSPTAAPPTPASPSTAQIHSPVQQPSPMAQHTPIQLQFSPTTVSHQTTIVSDQHAPDIIQNPSVNPNPDSVHPMVTRFRVGTNRPTERLNLHVSSVSPLPKSYRDAFNDPNWQNAMRDEYIVLIKNKTWTLVPRPPDTNIVRCMWLFRHKYLADGTLSRYKARLVANGSTQLEGVDVDETFSPVVKPGTIRTVMSLAASRHWPIHQLDVKNAFLRGIFLRLSICISLQDFETLLILIIRCDSSLFIYRKGIDTAYLLLYVDDIVLTASSKGLLQQIIGSSKGLLQQIIGSLHQEFAMTDLGPLNYFLGISITRDSSGLFLSQKKYAIEILEKAHMVSCNPSRTPVDTESKLGVDGDPVSDPTLYRSLAGSLQYLTFTRPDISYAVQQVCLHMHDPREPHLSALKRILRYVQGTLNYGLQLFSSSTTDLVAYSDADWAGCPTTRRSTSGYCVFLGNNLLSWSAKRQPTLSRSSAEAEYRGVANAVAETCWLRNLLRELHTPLSSATLVYCDNVSAVYLSSNPVQHQRTKHIEIDIHFVRDLVAAGQVRVLHVPSRYQFADIFTKGLPSALFEEFRTSLSVRCPPAPTAGEC
ncbi:ribonuclease H-like domain-containing protein [Tanacetum coccineum]|uniref:Ribonuclease H-like domain-containing protein n=1 Tax=Tanacetum coccineum TaxID=301880 RepID=A0ABQ4XEU9_9ASTR